MKSTHNVIELAGAQNGLVIQYASDMMKTIDTVIFTSVKNNGTALQYVIDENLNDYMYARIVYLSLEQTIKGLK